MACRAPPCFHPMHSTTPCCCCCYCHPFQRTSHAFVHKHAYDTFCVAYCVGRSTIPTPKARIRGPFEMQQRQFPVRPAFVMTNNKVQRQNLCQSGPTCPNLPSHMATCMLLAPMSVLGTVCVFVCRHHHHSHQHQNHCLQVAAHFGIIKKKFSYYSLYLPSKSYCCDRRPSQLLMAVIF